MCTYVFWKSLYWYVNIIICSPNQNFFSAPNLCNFVNCVWVCNLSKTALAYLINYSLSKFLSSIESSRLHGPRSRRLAGTSQRKTQIIMSSKFFFFFKFDSSENIIWKKKKKKRKEEETNSSSPNNILIIWFHWWRILLCICPLIYFTNYHLFLILSSLSF